MNEASPQCPLEPIVGRLRDYINNTRDVLLRIEAADEIERLQAENETLRNALRAIGDMAHDKSTGPAVADTLWEIRTMAYEHA